MKMHPVDILNRSHMSPLQITAVIICISLNALDGFDVLAISFAAPGIVAEWNITRAELGVVLAMELVGMAVGSVLLGNAADKYGRKPTIQFCLVLMTLGMFAAVFVDSVYEMLLVRLITGVGIGGMLASTNAMVAEFANQRWRNLCVIMMAAGYPLGAIVGGSVASVLLEHYSWRSIFVLGGSATGLFILIVGFLLPESVEYLSNKQPRRALQRINQTLTRMGHSLVESLPVQSEKSQQPSFAVLASPQMRMLTILLVIAYFAQIMTFYYILKWIPKIAVDMGFTPSMAGQALVWANVGGATGAILLGLFASRFNLRYVLIGVMVLAFIMVSVFGMGHSDLQHLSMVSALTGFFTNAGVVGLYALMARVFPAHVRASGTGVVIGVGRGGAALGPVVAGLLFTGGVGLQGVSIVMGSGALLAALSLVLLGYAQRKAERTSQTEHLSRTTSEQPNR